MLEFKTLDPPERKRTYYYNNPNGLNAPYELDFANVTAICVRSDGAHRLELANGCKAIVLPGFVAILMEVDAWTF